MGATNSRCFFCFVLFFWWWGVGRVAFVWVLAHPYFKYCLCFCITHVTMVSKHLGGYVLKIRKVNVFFGWYQFLLDVPVVEGSWWEMG